MNEGARIDYFRSEIKGDIARLEKQITDDRKAYAEQIRQLEDRITKLTGEVMALALR
jgi:hypothetical protein